MNRLNNIGCRLALAMALCSVTAYGFAQQVESAVAVAAKNNIEGLQISQQGGLTIVKLTLKQPLAAVPSSFSIANPARVAFDFPATANGLGRNSQQVNEGELRSINIVQVGERTRLVLNLNKMASYETRLDGAALYITFAPQTAAIAEVGGTAAPLVSHFSTTKPQAAVQSLRDINFRRGRDGEARVLVDLSDPNVGIDIQKQGGNLLVDFKKTVLPEKLNRRLDVTDFATPVTAVHTRQQGDNVRMTLTPRGLWEHNAYQSDNQFVIEVRPVSLDPNKLVQGTSDAAQAEKLSLNFQNIDIRAVLQVIADFTNFNIITSDSVAGDVTLRLKDVPWDQALDIILQSKGLGMRKNGNVLWIAPHKEIVERDKQQAESRQALSMSEPIKTETFQINYAKAEKVADLLSGKKTEKAKAPAANAAGESAAQTTPAASSASPSGIGERGEYLSNSGVVTVDARTNQIFVTDFPTYLERVRKLIAQVDKPVKKVLIEARIVSAEDNFGRSLGVRLGYNDLTSTVPGQGVGSKVPGTSTYSTVSGNLEGIFSLTGQTNGGGTAAGSAQSVAQSTFVNLPATNQGGVAASSIAVSLFKSGLARFINLELQAAETDGRVKGIASPRVVTEDGGQALISQGVDIPYTVISTNGTPTTSYRNAVLKLSVTPQITSDGTVILDLDVSQDTVGTVYTSGVSINTKNIKTRASIENGGTVVLGGIFEQNEQETTNKVPLLGDLPVVGNLFKSNTRTQARKELLVFITPRIIDELLQAAVH